MIISGGLNVFPVDIEEVVSRHPNIIDVTVIGVPHEKWGESPKALVVLRENMESDEESLILFCRERLANFKCPTSIEFVPELPRTATGKLQKFKLREMYWGDEKRKVRGA